MTPEIIGGAILMLGVLLLVAKLVRVRWGLAQRLFLPSSIIGGFIGLLLGAEGLGAGITAVAGEEAPLAGGLFPEEVTEVWAELPGLLIAVVFATLFLGKRIPRPSHAVQLGGPQLALGVTMGAGQYVIGLVLALLVLTPFFGLNPMAGALIEIGFEGGHGTAAGLGGTFDDLGFPEGADLALGMATVGIVLGIVVGIAFVNWGVRTGRTEVLAEQAEASLTEQRGLFEREDQTVAAHMTVRPASVEPLAIHFAIVAIAVLIGQLLLSGLQALEAATWGEDLELFEHVPLFPLAMIGGVVVQLVVDRIDRTGVVDGLMMSRIQGLALDVLVVSALATLSLEVIGEHIVPFLLLAGAGVAWNVGVFMFLAQRMLPTYWFERGVGDFGQSMGVTATGLILMRVADPNGETPALESFGYKQLGFEPFLGGGLITGLALPLIAEFGPVPFLIGMAALLVLALATGLMYFGRQRPEDRAHLEES